MSGEEPRETDVTNGTGEVDTGGQDEWWNDGSEVVSPGPGGVPVYSDVDGIVQAGGGGFDIYGDTTAIASNIAGLASTAGAILVDPVGWLVRSGLDFLLNWVQPLNDLVGLVTGNPGRMKAEIEKWINVREAMEPLAGEVRSVANEDLREWAGDAGDVAKTRLGELADAIDNIKDSVYGAETLLGLAEFLATTLQDVLKAELGRFVSNLVYRWVAAVAAAGPTFGASTAAAAAWTAVQYAFTVVRFGQTIQRGTSIFGSFGPVLLKILNFLDKYKDTLKTAASTVVTSTVSDIGSNPDNEMSDQEVSEALQ